MVPAVIIGVVYIPYVAKPIRAQVLTLREREFVDAARQQGLRPARIMFGEILPNLSSTILVFVPLILANAILLEAALSYLGAGVQPPNPVVGDDDLRRRAPDPGGDPPDARARHHARARGARDQRVRRRRARRTRPARAGAGCAFAEDGGATAELDPGHVDAQPDLASEIGLEGRGEPH